MLSFCKIIKTYQYQPPASLKRKKLSRTIRSRPINQISFSQESASPIISTHQITNGHMRHHSNSYSRNGLSLSIKQTKIEKPYQNSTNRSIPIYEYRRQQSRVQESKVKINYLSAERNNPQQLKIIESKITRESQSVINPIYRSTIITSRHENRRQKEGDLLNKMSVKNQKIKNNSFKFDDNLPNMVNNDQIELSIWQKGYSSKQKDKKLDSFLKEKLQQSVYDRKDNEQQNVRLSCSCSSNSEIKVLTNQNDVIDWNKSCQLKLNDSQPSFLGIKSVDESIIINNKAFIDENSQFSIILDQSKINQENNNSSMISYSPVKRIKNKYNGNLLNIYDKGTILSISNQTSRVI